MPGYTLVPALERASLEDYVTLFRDSFAGDGKLTSKYLDWEYVTNPHGKVIGFDAYLGDELAAHYAIIPRRYRLGSNTFDAALSVNTATHPKHQGNGLFIKLADATYQAAADRAVKFVVGVANANSVGGFTRRLGFSVLGQVRLYACFKAPSQSEDALNLDVQSDWLRWRLANPSREYGLIMHRDGSTTVRTRVRGVPFNIARIDSSIVNHGISVQPALGSALMPALAPVFGWTAPSAPRLPLKAQSSPWHVIWRSLDANCDASLAAHLRFDGLAMDTF